MDWKEIPLLIQLAQQTLTISRQLEEFFVLCELTFEKWSLYEKARGASSSRATASIMAWQKGVRIPNMASHILQKLLFALNSLHFSTHKSIECRQSFFKMLAFFTFQMTLSSCTWVMVKVYSTNHLTSELTADEKYFLFFRQISILKSRPSFTSSIQSLSPSNSSSKTYPSEILWPPKTQKSSQKCPKNDINHRSPWHRLCSEYWIIGKLWVDSVL